MRPVLTDGKLTVELAVRERETLSKARELGVLLDSLHQPTGAALVAAVDAILVAKGATAE